MDPYSVLGLRSGATKAEIKTAFKALAQECHPDKLASASEYQQQQGAIRFRAVKDAYEALTNARKANAFTSAQQSSSGAAYGGAASAQYQQWQYEEFARRRMYGRRRYVQTASFMDWVRYAARNFTRADAAFHGALFAITFGGFWALSTTGETLWHSANKGKLFEDVVAVQQRRKQQQMQGQSAPHPPTLQSATLQSAAQSDSQRESQVFSASQPSSSDSVGSQPSPAPK